MTSTFSNYVIRRNPCRTPIHLPSQSTIQFYKTDTKPPSTILRKASRPFLKCTTSNNVKSCSLSRFTTMFRVVSRPSRMLSTSNPILYSSDTHSSFAEILIATVQYQASSLVCNHSGPSCGDLRTRTVSLRMPTVGTIMVLRVPWCVLHVTRTTAYLFTLAFIV